MAVAGQLRADSPSAWSGDGETTSVAAWLGWLRREAEARLAECRQEEQQLEQLWQHIVSHSDQLRPHELQRLVEELIHAASRTTAATTAAEVAAAAAVHDQHPAARPTPLIDEDVLRRLLDGIAADRSATAVSLVRDVLELLCSMTLDLELTERRVGTAAGDAGHALSDLRSHVTAAASRLRALPTPATPLLSSGEQLAVVVRRVLGAYAGSLEIGLEWYGGDPQRVETSAAMLWVMQELVHHLHSTLAGRCDVMVRVEESVTQLTVSTPSAAFDPTGDPEWLLRTQLRVELAGGGRDDIELGAEAWGGSSVTVRLRTV